MLFDIIIGNPFACASINVKGIPSKTDGNKKISIADKILLISFLLSKKITLSSNFFSCILFFISFFNGPSPTKIKQLFSSIADNCSKVSIRKL